MKCPNCNSNQTVKNGQRKGRQCYKCKQCGRQFLESYHPWRYSDDVKQLGEHATEALSGTIASENALLLQVGRND